MPLATTEGALAASIMRGTKALNDAGGVTSIATEVGMTRSPLVKLDNVRQAADLKTWIQQPQNFEGIRAAFESTTSYGKLLDIHIIQSGRYLHVRHRADCRLALGMNMASKGCETSMKYITEKFGAGRLLTLSGNTCNDKKANTINTILGRSKNVVAEVFLNKSIIEGVLRTTAERLVECNTQKNLIGSGLAGSHAAGFNAHAANTVAGMFIATGQDAAQVTTSASCVTSLEVCGSDEPERQGCIHMTVTMPSLEIACLSGGTSLDAQNSLMGLTGVLDEPEKERTLRLAEVMAAFVLAGELNLLAALTAGHLVSAHMNLNRNGATSKL
jgi:hydroxymethylglutaryl-CoA reductase (NADPH)